ncbi:MAG TPA: hypothetical protein VFJ98_03525 [Mycobacteriales bacterium]|nr:hypothetical protein [Mycobacteriales bacterium]
MKILSGGAASATLLASVLVVAPPHAQRVEAATTPSITSAVMRDANLDAHADQLVLTYNVKVNHAADSDGHYPLAVSGYTIRKISAASASRTLTVTLAPKSGRDITAHPTVSYTRTSSRPVRSTTGVQAAAQTFRRTTSLAAQAVLARSTGTDVSTCGTASAPCATIQYAVNRAAARSRHQVYVAGGSYPAFVVHAGVNVLGGFGSTFGPGTATTTVRGAALSAIAHHWAAVVASGLTATTTVGYLTVSAGTPTTAGATSYGVYASNIASGRLVLSRDVIRGGNGAAGSAGAAGQDAPSVTATGEMDGRNGGAGLETTISCDDTSHGVGGAAGVNGAAASASGGHGGDGGTMDSDCSTFSMDFDAQPGHPGANAVVTGGGGGLGGAGGTGTTQCGPGTSGTAGKVVNGPGGAGGAGGGDVGGYWVAGDGSDGGGGSGGGGGGGGGGQGGCDNGTDSYGGGGGGGGAGGVAAVSGGGGGTAGGGSFAVYLVNASPRIVSTAIVGGTGGAGGPGGAGGQGQDGGAGGQGNPAFADTGAAGNGGNGGHGGHGGGGGGGAGGDSYLLYLVGTSSPVLSAVSRSTGAGGIGGAGGPSAPNAAVSDGNPGASGTGGTAGQCNTGC